MYAKKYVVVLMVLISAVLYANSSQDINASSESCKNRISYQMNSYSLSYFRLISDRVNLRFNIRLDGAIYKNSYKDEYNLEYGSTSIIKSSDIADIDEDAQIFGILIQYMRYMKKDKRANFYFAIGPSFSIQYNSYRNEGSEIDYDDEAPYESTIRSNSTYKVIGATGTFGIEINFSKRIGVFGAYDIDYNYRWSKKTYESGSYYGGNPERTKSTTSNNGWYLDISNFLFGVFVNF